MTCFQGRRQICPRPQPQATPDPPSPQLMWLLPPLLFCQMEVGSSVAGPLGDMVPPSRLGTKEQESRVPAVVCQVTTNSLLGPWPAHLLGRPF